MERRGAQPPVQASTHSNISHSLLGISQLTIRHSQVLRPRYDKAGCLVNKLGAQVSSISICYLILSKDIIYFNGPPGYFGGSESAYKSLYCRSTRCVVFTCDDGTTCYDLRVRCVIILLWQAGLERVHKTHGSGSAEKWGFRTISWRVSGSPTHFFLPFTVKQHPSSAIDDCYSSAGGQSLADACFARLIAVPPVQGDHGWPFATWLALRASVRQTCDAERPRAGRQGLYERKSA